MNGRTARKIVWRNRSSYLFGRRSFVTVRFPVSIYPEPRPHFEEPGKCLGFSGWWGKPDGDTIVTTRIGKISGPNPETIDHTRKNGYEPTVYFPKKCYEFPDKDGIMRESWEWWEITCNRHKKPEDPEDMIGEMIGDPWEPDNAESIIAAYKARDEWDHKYIHCMMTEEEYDGLSPLLRRVLMLNGPSKTQELNGIENGYASITWVVKYFYPTRRAAFAALLGRMTKAMKRAGHDVRVY